MAPEPGPSESAEPRSGRRRPCLPLPGGSANTERQGASETARASETRRFEDLQRHIFGQLARAGVYDADGSPPAGFKAFVQTCVETVLPTLGCADLKVLDCGCGSGLALQTLRDTLERCAPGRHRYYGFDLSPDMIALARRRLPEVSPTRLHVGSVLDAESYSFDAEEPLFDLVCCKAVVEQIPPTLQFRAVETMLEHVGAGGAAILFEKERYSRYGLAMGARKFVTRRLGLPLVPRFYTAARYPPLGRFRRRLAKRLRSANPTRRFRPTVLTMPDGSLRALIVGVSEVGVPRDERVRN